MVYISGSIAPRDTPTDQTAVGSSRNETRTSRKDRTRSAQYYLKRFFGLAHVSRAIFETREFFEEGERNFADWTISLLCDDQFGFTGFFGARFFVFFVNLRTHEQPDEISVLFDRSGLTQIAQTRFAAGSGFRLSIQLGDHDHRDLQFFRETFDPR